MNEELDTSGAVSSYLQGETADVAQRARVSLNAAINTKPDFEARIREQAAAVGVPLSSARAMPEEVNRRATMAGMDFESMAQRTPNTMKFLADEEKAKIAHDDVKNLGLIENTINALGTTAKYVFSHPTATNTLMGDIGAGFWKATRGAAGVQQAISELPAPLLDFLEPSRAEDYTGWRGAVGGNPLRRLAEGFAAAGAGADARAKALSPPTTGILAGGVSSGVQSLVQNVLTMPLALLPGGQAAALTMMAAGTGGDAYQDAREQGLSPLKALPFAASQAVIEYATEKLPMTRLIGDLKVGTPLLKTLTHQLAAELPGEQIATILQDMNEWAVLPKNKDKPFSQYLAERPSAAAQTLIATAIGVGGNVAVTQTIGSMAGKAQNDAWKAQEAEQGMRVLQDLMAAASKSKLLERDPQALAEFVQNVADGGKAPREVFIDAKALAETLAQSGITVEQATAAMPSLGAQLQEALQRGGDVTVPLGEFTAGTAGSPLGDALMQHVRTSPDALSAKEAGEGMKTAEKELGSAAKKAMDEQTAESDTEKSAAAVRENIFSQLQAAGRFTPDVNAAYADMMKAFYATQAKRLGVSPEELFKQHPVNIRAADTGDSPRAFNQGANAPTLGQVLDREGAPLKLSISKQTFGNNAKMPNALLVELHDPKSGERRGFIDFSIREDGVLTSENTKVAPALRGKGLAEAMYKAARDAGYDIAPGKVQTDAGLAMVNKLQAKGLINKEAEGKRFRAGDLDLVPLEGGRLNQGESKARGTFSPSTSTITLLAKADLSTFLHESGHFYLEALAAMAEQENAPAEIQADMDTVLKWFGVPDLATWRSMTLDQQREHHEKFARGFEAYLFEGKAPSLALSKMFNRFASWMKRIYLSMRNLNVEISPEIRGVFDRMLASDEQIKEAEAARSYAPMFKDAKEAGMTEQEWADYQALAAEATESGVAELQRRGLRDMQWLTNARSRVLKALQKNAKAQRQAVEAEVTAEVLATPLEKARDAAKATKPKTEAEWDVLAETQGFSSGDELRKQLADTPSRKDVIEGMTDQRMLERHGDLVDDEALQRATEAALANEARGRFIATELAATNKALGKPRVLIAAAKQYAAQIIGRKTVKDIKPGQYAAAEARAAREAAKSKDVTERTIAKRNQLLNHYIAAMAAEAQAEVERGVDYLKKFDKDGVRKALDVEYTDQIDALLERHDLRKSTSLADIRKRQNLAAWVESQREMGLEPDIPANLLNELERTSYKELTLDDFRGLVDTVKQIEHLGRLKHKLLTAKDQREFAAVKDEIVESIQANSKGRVADTRTPNTLPGQALIKLKNFWASHIKAATWARVMDGGKDGGPMWEHIIRAANEAGDKETGMREKATKELAALVGTILPDGKMGGKGVFFESIGRSLNREARLAIALNVGNEGNLQRLLGGEGWTQQQLQPVLDSLTAGEWQFVQKVWDYFESYRPEIAAKERRVYGKEPNWVEPTPVKTQFGELRGGYYPIKYDSRASEKAESHAQAEDAKRQMQGAYTSATTRRSFTKARTDEVKGRPLLYSLDGIYNGVQEIIHDLSWHEFLIDANRLIKNRAISSTMRNTYGPEVHQQFKSWLEDVAAGDRPAQGAAEASLGWLRQGVSISGLGFNVMSAIMQPLGLTQSMVRIGPKWVGRGLSKALGSPLETTAEISEKSTFMRTRFMTRLREINEVRNQVKGQTALRRGVDTMAYALMLRCQQLVDVPTWWGAYEKAIAEGNDDERASKLADQAVIDSQGGGQTKDLAAIERGGPALKLFTTFYSFFNTALNVGAQSTMTEDNKAKLAANYLLLYVVPALLGAALKDALTPGDSGDWDDPDKLVRKLIGEQLSYLTGLMFGVREIGNPVAAIVKGQHVGTDYTGPAGTRLIGDLAKLTKEGAQGQADDGLRKAVVNVAGEVLRLPSAQINRTVTGAKAMADGKTSNPAAIAFGFQEPH